MNIKKKLYVALAAITFCAFGTTAQNLQSASTYSKMHSNLLAKQNRVKDQIRVQEAQKYAADLYEECEPEPDIYTEGWDSNLVNCYKDANVPNSKVLDVRHYVMPIKGNYVTSHYGYRPQFGRTHKGVDLRSAIGDTVYSAFSTKNWYPGLILMITKNDENLELRNGDVVICGYDADQPGSKRVWVQMENKKFRSISFGMLSDYETGFAMTIHKSQGSEFDHTMMIMNGTERTITRELVYTGITRAKSFVTMVTGNDGKHDVKNLNERFNVKVRRTSGLDERLYGKDKA